MHESRALIASAPHPHGQVGYLRWRPCNSGADTAACDSGGAACLGHVFVAPSHRRSGVAQLLLAYFFEQAVLRFDVACLSVEEWNAGARALYLKVGFVDSGGGVLVKKF